VVVKVAVWLTGDTLVSISVVSIVINLFRTELVYTEGRVNQNHLGL